MAVKKVALVFAYLLLSTHGHLMQFASHEAAGDEPGIARGIPDQEEDVKRIAESMKATLSDPKLQELFKKLAERMKTKSVDPSVQDLYKLGVQDDKSSLKAENVQEFGRDVAKEAKVVINDPGVQEQAKRAIKLVQESFLDDKVLRHLKVINEQVEAEKVGLSEPELQELGARKAELFLADPYVQLHGRRMAAQVSNLINDPVVLEQVERIAELIGELSSNPKIQDSVEKISEQMKANIDGSSAKEFQKDLAEHSLLADPDLQEYVKLIVEHAKGSLRDVGGSPSRLANSLAQVQQGRAAFNPHLPRSRFRSVLKHGAPLRRAARTERISRTMNSEPMMQSEPKAADTNKEAEDGSGGIRQLLGLKGASTADTDAPFNWKVRLQLTKPATWIPLIWGVGCGAAASGNYHAIWNLFGDAPTTNSVGLVAEDTIKALSAMVLAGPFMCGFTQTINDWFDRELDAINEPYRPIPSGAISTNEVYQQIAFLLVGSGVLAYGLDNWAQNEVPVITGVALFGAFMAYIYSAPPLKLKAEGWVGTYALGSSYIALPWLCGHGMFNAGSITPQEVLLTVLYSIAGLGIAIVNDFKSIEGDRDLGMNSLPVALGVDTAKWVTVASIDITQLGVAAYLASIGETRYAAILFGLVLPQMYSQINFLKDPVANDVKYQAAAQPFLVGGILDTALAIGHHTF